ncbi:MAG: hypothetical protein WBA54_00580 [Acidaminobacteraceae bacterium]
MEILKKYENSNLKPLLQLSSVTAMLDSFLIKRISDIKQARFLRLIDSLDDGSINIKDEEIKSDDFINKFLLTTNSVINTRKLAKQDLFTRLFKNSIESNELLIDDFEELIIILDSLSQRELIILMNLKRYENKKNYDHIMDENDEYAYAKQFWSEFMNETQLELKIEADILISHLTRLNRTGLYRTYNGFWTSNDIVGKTTKLFDELQKALI